MAEFAQMVRSVFCRFVVVSYLDLSLQGYVARVNLDELNVLVKGRQEAVMLIPSAAEEPVSSEHSEVNVILESADGDK